MRQTDRDSDQVSALHRHEALVQGLMSLAAYPEPVDDIRRIDTHISTVLLAGDHAYKLRKPVKLGFLDFSTLEHRRRDCEEELRLNRRTAPGLYLDVAAIAGTLSAPRFIVSAQPPGDALEYAVRMRRFDERFTLDHVAESGELTPGLVDRLAEAVAAMHAQGEIAAGKYGTAQQVSRWIDDNFVEIREQVQSAQERARLDDLSRWAAVELQEHHDLLTRRRAEGFVRECHGDLHLGNIVLWNGAPTPFDAIEFNAELRFIDVISDVAFTFMDLCDHGTPELGWRFISAYLESTGDYEGLALLRLYAVYRALVRAKVALVRQNQPEVKHHVRLRERASFERYLELAERLRRPNVKSLVVMTGLPGSGKSTVARVLAPALGGVRIRSDVERKRLHGLEATADSKGSIYGEQANRQTYDRLALLAATALRAGVPAVIDAASLKRSERRRFVELGAAMQASVAIVVCTAPVDILRERLRARGMSASDPSEATEVVLERLCIAQEGLDSNEQRFAHVVDTSGDLASVERSATALAAALASGIA